MKICIPISEYIYIFINVYIFIKINIFINDSYEIQKYINAKLSYENSGRIHEKNCRD